MTALLSTAVYAWHKSKDASGHEHDAAGRFTSGGAAKEMASAHPHPGEAPPRPAGLGRPDLLAKDPSLRAAAEAHGRHTRDYHRHYAAGAMDRLLNEPPPKLRLPQPEAPEGRRAALYRAAHDQLQAAEADVDALSGPFAAHAEEVAATHPQGGKALAEARAEAKARRDAAYANARAHADTLPPLKRARALVELGAAVRARPDRREKPASNLPAGKSAAKPESKLP